MFVLENVIAQEAVGTHNSTFAEFSRYAIVLSFMATRRAAFITARTPYSRDHQITRPDPRYVGSGLDDLGQGFMTQDEIRPTLWGCAVLERADLTICAADADFHDSEQHIGTA